MGSVKNIDLIGNLSDTLESFSESYDLFILFVDLCDSTEIKQYCLDNSLPDSIWITRQKIFLSRVSKIVIKYKGDIIKTIGDEIMATFSFEVNPESIINCIIEIFQTFDNLKTYNKGIFKIYSKASVDFGTCYDGQIMDQKIIDPIGTCVDRCARLTKHAEKNEIVISNEFKDIFDQANGLIRKLNLIEQKKILKGIGDTIFFKINIKKK